MSLRRDDRLEARQSTESDARERERDGVGLAALAALAVAVGLVPAAVAACGTIIHGSSQDVGISSVPTGAAVTVDGKRRGETPVVAELSREDEHEVRIELAGYEPYEMTLTNSTSGWVWGNIVFGGLVGLAVDAITGGLYKLEPKQVEAELTEGAEAGAGDAAVAAEDGRLLLRVVLKPDPDWTRIGTLETGR